MLAPAKRSSPGRLLGATLLVVGLAACGEDRPPSSFRDPLGPRPVEVATAPVVQPFAGEAAKGFERFGTEDDADVKVVRSKTQTALRRLCSGETDIAATSRPMRPEERAACRDRGIDPTGLRVAHQAVAVVANRNLRIDCLTVDQLRRLWSSGATVRRYESLDPTFPARTPTLFGAERELGTSELLAEELLEGDARLRTDYEPVGGHNLLLRKVAADPAALGFANYASVDHAAPTTIRLLAVDAGDACVQPTAQAIQAGDYELARPLFLYPSDKALVRPEVQGFLRYVIGSYRQIAKVSPTIVPLSAQELEQAEERLSDILPPTG